MASKNPQSIRKKRSEAWVGDESPGHPSPTGNDYVTYLKEVITLKKKKKVPIKLGVKRMKTPGDDRNSRWLLRVQKFHFDTGNRTAARFFFGANFATFCNRVRISRAIRPKKVPLVWKDRGGPDGVVFASVVEIGPREIFRSSSNRRSYSKSTSRDFRKNTVRLSLGVAYFAVFCNPVPVPHTALSKKVLLVWKDLGYLDKAARGLQCKIGPIGKTETRRSRPCVVRGDRTVISPNGASGVWKRTIRSVVETDFGVTRAPSY
ncbi:hypothetical protein NPIL_69591 [Nephila pilipes]|uniref:Uncharacterized protein n=1 Tax=Nephila pilipes TaxID=299642 RepID=A0A8X6QX15_NEPPI|nr:hypothetical protein NPIL_69591 [Nephila pilipes]